MTPPCPRCATPMHSGGAAPAGREGWRCGCGFNRAIEAAEVDAWMRAEMAAQEQMYAAIGDNWPPLASHYEHWGA